MSDDHLDDLKQFIDSRLSRSEQSIRDDLIQKAEQLRGEMHDGFAGVGEAIDEIDKRLDEHDKEVDQRLTPLEQQAA